jgi:hypothetical protein
MTQSQGKVLFMEPRKPIELFDLRSDSEIVAETERKILAGNYLNKRLGSTFIKGFNQPFARFSAREAMRGGRLPENFGINTLGDYVCNVINTKIIGSAHGRITRILLAVPPTDSAAVNERDERHITTLIRLMDGHTKFCIVCRPEQVPTVESWATKYGLSPARFEICLSVFDYSIWAQDAYVNLLDQNGRTVLCEGVCFPRYDDMTIADDVAMQTDISALQSYLYFQGNNVLSSRDFAIVGMDYVKRNIGRPQLESEDKVLDRFAGLLGRKTIALGRSTPIPRADRANAAGDVAYLSGTYQPVFHIDMYVTPTGVIGASGKEIVMIGRPAKAREITGEADGKFDFDSYFLEAQTQLELNFEVVELPLYPVKGKGRGGKDWHYHLTYNNAVLENYTEPSGANRRIVYMPTFAGDADAYGLPKKPREKLDAEAKSIWQSIGFEVREMDGLEDLAHGLGSVHCITKELGRTDYPSLTS